MKILVLARLRVQKSESLLCRPLLHPAGLGGRLSGHEERLAVFTLGWVSPTELISKNMYRSSDAAQPILDL